MICGEMGKVVSVHEKKATKQPRSKKKPVKVVYISNPMKFKTTASEFRALVQELTGRDTAVPDPSKYSEIDGAGSHAAAPAEYHHEIKSIADDDHDHQALQLQARRFTELPVAGEVTSTGSGSGSGSDLAFEPYDDVFMPQMLENFTGFLPSTLFIESPHVDALRSLDAV